MEQTRRVNESVVPDEEDGEGDEREEEAEEDDETVPSRPTSNADPKYKTKSMRGKVTQRSGSFGPIDPEEHAEGVEDEDPSAYVDANESQDENFEEEEAPNPTGRGARVGSANTPEANSSKQSQKAVAEESPERLPLIKGGLIPLGGSKNKPKSKSPAASRSDPWSRSEEGDVPTKPTGQPAKKKASGKVPSTKALKEKLQAVSGKQPVQVAPKKKSRAYGKSHQRNS